MTARANFVIPERGVRAIRRKLMAKRAIGPKSSACVNSRVGVHVFRVRKFKNNRTLVLEARKRQQFLGGGRRKRSVALQTNLLLQIFIEVILMTGAALVMPRPLQRDRTWFHRNVTGVAIDPHRLQVEFVQLERSFRRRLR